MSQLLISLILLYPWRHPFIFAYGQCLISCQPCRDATGTCLSCTHPIEEQCISEDINYFESTDLCGEDCILCCEGDHSTSRQCMRASNRTRLNTSLQCWSFSQFLNTSRNEMQDDRRGDPRGPVIGLSMILVFFVFMGVCREHRRRQLWRVNPQVLQVPASTLPPSTLPHTPPSSPPIGTRGASEVVVVVAPDGEVDVGLKDTH